MDSVASQRSERYFVIVIGRPLLPGALRIDHRGDAGARLGGLVELHQDLEQAGVEEALLRDAEARDRARRL